MLLKNRSAFTPLVHDLQIGGRGPRGGGSTGHGYPPRATWGIAGLPGDRGSPGAPGSEVADGPGLLMGPVSTPSAVVRLTACAPRYISMPSRGACLPQSGGQETRRRTEPQWPTSRGRGMP